MCVQRYSYIQIYRKAPKNEVEKKYNEKVKTLPWDMLRSAKL